jgi:murein tripeptide amidase MpaA
MRLVPLLLLAPTLAVAETDWRLTYEKSNFQETGRYGEAVEFCDRLQKVSPYARVIRFGKSGEGRQMVALLLSKDKQFTPWSIRRSEKPLILLNNGIHPGEIEGKDADLMLARNILVNKREEKLLDSVNILLIPVFNVDGHERFGPFNRINQNGPKRMGWRVTSTNLNLNRDFTKVDTVEMRAWLKLFHEWRPDFFFDNHTTDGADWQYDVAYAMPLAPTMDSGLAAWSQKLLDDVLPKIAKDGHPISPYFGGFDNAAPEKGFSVDDFSPRYSTGYGMALNRPCMLVETHVLKPYKKRVETTYSVNKRVIEYCARFGKELKAAVAKADKAAQAVEGSPVVLSAKLTTATRPFTFLGYEFKPYQSEISGAEIPAWDRNRAVSVPSVIRDRFEPALVVNAPYAYAIPPQWTSVIDVLDAHAISFRRTTKASKAILESYKFQKVQFPRTPFEGRFMPNFDVANVKEERELPAGTVVVTTEQTRSKLIMHLLEPAAPDSLAHWGFFNAIFEEKEFFEDYAMEPIAQRMLEKYPQIKKDFEEKLKDPGFANSPRERLQFFWDRSGYADIRLNKYPIVRLSRLEAEGLR